MSDDIVELKKLFRGLRQLGVSELRVPKKQYLEIEKTFNDGMDSLDMTMGYGTQTQFRRSEDEWLAVRLEIEGFYDVP